MYNHDDGAAAAAGAAAAQTLLSTYASVSPLHEAAVRDDTEALATLIAAGANVNALDIADRTALRAAAVFRQVAAARILLTHGARLEVTGDAVSARGEQATESTTPPAASELEKAIK